MGKISITGRFQLSLIVAVVTITVLLLRRIMDECCLARPLCQKFRPFITEVIKYELGDFISIIKTSFFY